jgi:hypothetical protein
MSSFPDPRHSRGRVHPLVGILSLVILGLMAGARSLSDISRFGTIHPEILQPLGLRRSPSTSTLSRLLRAVPVEAVWQALFDFARKLAQLRGETGLGALAADGKTLGGVWEDGKQLHVLHIFAQEAGLALDQLAVGEVSAEPEAVKTWVEKIADKYPGFKVLTGDALMAQRDLFKAIVENYRDYLLRLKKTSTGSMPT